ncbi:hypothetical protein [Streptomyces sp. t39]|uniref:hypothetical protein n=1 Tax=Streptomyces sp. t39 TaxID=1828156 RepID=UPI0011CE745A|nr:hypothetical protein [Streptomyces sp. t39]TXS35310.1 hypothetical protein EAO77_37100 [Streptomyces sp. t39]
MTTPTLRILSLGAGVQSTTLFLLIQEGRIPKPDVAIFADTGWEPADVYAHLDRIEREIAQPMGIPILRVTSGNIRDDALDPDHRFVSMPTFTIGPCQTCIPRGHLGIVYDLPLPDDDGDGPATYTGTCLKCRGTGIQHGMGRRQCTKEYKLVCIKKGVRQVLGYPHPVQVPRGVYAEQLVGISRDEFERAKDTGLQYLRSTFPLLYLDGAADGREGWTRADCRRYLTARGWGSTPRSACIGCPFRSNREWRQMRDTRPTEWADAVDFDRRLRAMPRADGLQEFLHASRVPLDQAPIDRVSHIEWKGRQTTVFDQIADAEAEETTGGCGPWSCRSGEPVAPAA